MRAVVVLLLGLALPLASCAAPRATTPPQPAAPDSAPAPAALQKVVAMGTNITFAQIAMPVAKETGLFEKHGLDAEVLFGPRSITALMAGEVQFGAGTDDAVVANLNGADLVVIATMIPYVQHKYMARPEIQTIADLKDRPVGLGKRGNYPHALTRMVAQRGGLDPERDLLIVEIPDTASQVAALTSGAIVGVPLVPPATDIAEANGARVLVDLSKEKIDYAVMSLVADRAWAAQNESAVLGFLRAVAEAAQMVHTQPDVVRDVYMKWAKSDEQAANTAVALARDVVAIKMYPRHAAIQRVLDVAADQVPAAAGADPARFYDDRFIRQLEQEGFYTRLGVN